MMFWPDRLGGVFIFLVLFPNEKCQSLLGKDEAFFNVLVQNNISISCFLTAILVQN